MTRREFTAELGDSTARAFGRKPSGSAPMSIDEALNVQVASAFRRPAADGQPVTAARVAEAERVLAEAKSTSNTRPGGVADVAEASGPMFDHLVQEHQRLTVSRLGMSAERAALRTESEVLRLRSEFDATPESVLEGLRTSVARLQMQKPLGGS